LGVSDLFLDSKELEAGPWAFLILLFLNWFPWAFPEFSFFVRFLGAVSS
jgi:hypothetical protein